MTDRLDVKTNIAEMIDEEMGVGTGGNVPRWSDGDGWAYRPGEIAPKPPKVWPVMGHDEIFAQLPPINWLCEGLSLAPGAPVVFGGYGFSGKTMAAQAMALAITCGAPIWDGYPTRQGKVLHVDYEQGSYLTRLRYQRLARGMGLVPDPGLLSLSSLPPYYLDGEETLAPLMRACEGHSLVIVDSLRASAPTLDENSSEIRVILDDLNRIAEQTGCLGLVIVHSRKPSGDDAREGGGSPKFAIRGSSGIFDAAGSLFALGGTGKNGPIKVSHEKNRITGKLCEDFALTISDTQGGGLSVTAGDMPVRASAGTAEIDATVLEFVTKRPGLSGRQITASVTGRNEAIRDAMARLEVSGDIESRPGETKNSRLWFPSQAEKGAS